MAHVAKRIVAMTLLMIQWDRLGRFPREIDRRVDNMISSAEDECSCLVMVPNRK